MPLEGRVVTADALLTQREVCEQIVEQGGDYLFPVKDNQPALEADIAGAFSPSPGLDAESDRLLEALLVLRARLLLHLHRGRIELLEDARHRRHVGGLRLDQLGQGPHGDEDRRGVLGGLHGEPSVELFADAEVELA